jgi:Domain of unknown function (DUF4262)
MARSLDVYGDEDIARSVARHGWHAISVFDHAPPFVYTCGLMTTFQHPEAIIFGLGSETAYSVLNTIVDAIRNGRSFAATGKYDGVLVDLPIATRPVHRSQHELYLGHAMGHCRYTGNPGGLVAVQVFWPDKQGKFPFELGCDQTISMLLPRLDLPVPDTELHAFRRRFRS